MKSTGITRKIDNLGRIVIPKEIRNRLHIKVGENLEIYTTDNDSIVLKKFSNMDNITSLAFDIVDSANKIIKENVIITDSEKVIAINGPLKKVLLNSTISENIYEMMKNRKQILNSNMNELSINHESLRCSYAISTILVNGEVLGSIIVLSQKRELTQEDFDLIQFISIFFTKYLEE